MKSTCDALKIKQLLCFAHSINILISEAINNISAVRAKTTRQETSFINTECSYTIELEFLYDEKIEEVYDCICVVLKATAHSSGTSYVSVSTIIPLIKGLYIALNEKLQNIQNETVERCIQICMKTVEKRFFPYETRMPCV
ncbi:hypothetical protein PGB90_004988 [Kerria lacca]